MKIDVYNTGLWVRLTPRGLAHLTNYCAGFAAFGAKMPGNQMGRFTKQDGWYEFSLLDLSRIFATIMHDGHAVPFEENEVHTEQPF